MKTQIFIALIYIPIITSANTDFAKITKVGNVYLHYQKAYGRFEINKRVEIFQVLANKLIETQFKTNTKLFFYFYNNYENEEAKFIHVGFGKFQGFYFENQKLYTQGIKIVVRDIEFDIEKMLQLV